MRKSPSSKLATVGTVKKMISGSQETKFIGDGGTALYNQYISTPGDLVPLLPGLPNGDTENERIGAKVSPKGILVTMTLSLSKDNAHPGDVILPRILVLRSKNDNDMASLISNGGAQSYLLDSGTGQHAFSGLQADYRCAVNTNQFTVLKDIKTKLAMNYQEADSLLTRTYKFWIKCPKTLLYNDSQNYPRNFAPFFYASYAQADNTVDGSTTTKLRVDWSSTLYFKDE